MQSKAVFFSGSPEVTIEAIEPGTRRSWSTNRSLIETWKKQFNQTLSHVVFVGDAGLFGG